MGKYKDCCEYIIALEIPEANSEPYKTFKTKLFAKRVSGWNLLTIFANCSILDV